MTHFDSILKVSNRFLYTNLEQCTFEWILIRFPGPFDAGQNAIVIDSSTADAPALAPGESGTIVLGLPENWRQADVLQINIRDPHGRQVFSYHFPIHQPAEIVEQIIPRGQTPVSLREDEDFFFLSSGPNEVTIDRRSGLIHHIRHQGRDISLMGGPRMDLNLGLYRLEEIQAIADEQGNALAVRFEGIDQEDRKGLDWSLRYTMLPDGWLRLDYEYLPQQGKYEYLGVNFDYPEENVKGIRWLGRGPYRVWKNRMRGPQFGLWQKDFNNTVTGETLWQYPEFKGYHADLYWAEIQTTEGNIVLATETPDLFLRLYTPAPPAGAGNDHNNGIFPGGDISIMHAISPIGTKFKKAAELGPMSQPNQLYYNRNREPLTGTVYLNFGKGNLASRD